MDSNLVTIQQNEKIRGILFEQLELLIKKAQTTTSISYFIDLNEQIIALSSVLLSKNSN